MYVCIHITTYHGWRMVWLRHLARIVAPDTEILVTFRIIWRNYMTRVFVGILDACRGVCVYGSLCVCEKERERIYACVHVRLWVGVRVCIGGWARKSMCCQFFFFVHAVFRGIRMSHICEWVMSHVWMSHVTHVNEVMSHMWMSHVTHMDESCHVWMSRATRVYESCHKDECVMSHIWMRRATRMKKSCQIQQRGIHANIPHIHK